MKTTTTEYLLKVKGIEKSALTSIDATVEYQLKYNRKKKAKSILYQVIKDDLDRAYQFGVRYGRMVGKETKKRTEEIPKGRESDFIKTDSKRNRPTKYRLTRQGIFTEAMTEIQIERDRFFALYDLKVDTYLKDGYSRNQATTNIEVMKLEHELINRTRRIVANLVYMNAQIGQFQGMKKELG